ncbi:putative porin [Carboxylicivirga sp. N1Y90]|uniref:putative porin n=1 Tax=Carboxylicivirga fragile TaxID=3417571 RepID=UPI003D3267CB|nr:putative porin [Marinilabiliaceae bacterium N1Y90]
MRRYNNLALAKFSLLIVFLVFGSDILAQRTLQGPPTGAGNDRQQGEDPGSEEEQGVFIKPDVRVWHLTDDYTYSDSTDVDTLSAGYQIFNPIYKRSIANNYLGNMGSAYQSMIFSDREYRYGHLFENGFMAYIPEPYELFFVNTKTPYVNLTYHFGGPKRRSEETISVMFTQNVNRRWNVGAQYFLSSSIGMFQAQQAENQNFKFISSYNGETYNLHTAFIFSKVDNYENGGINRDEEELNFTQVSPEVVPMFFNTAENEINIYKLFLNQSLSIGKIDVKSNDSITNQLPVSTVYHTLELEHNTREHRIANLESYYVEGFDKAFYPNIYADSLQTRDSVSISTMSNTFQIKFNEEANSLLKFGLRAFIKNDITRYKYPKQPVEYDKVNSDYIPHYLQNDSTLVTTAIGAQIFKNLGKNFWWDAGAKLYIQGYRAGDSELTGSINSSFRLAKDTAGFFANGGIYLTTPELFESTYFSNHLKWDNAFRQKKIVRFNGGVRVPTKHLELSAGGQFINDHIYWQFNGLPEQTSDVLQVYHAALKKQFKFGGFRSHNNLVFQHSSDQDIIPLPMLAYYNSTYYQNTLFKVLYFQIGFDFRYNSKYYAPFYMPATSQFVNQKVDEVGEYPWVDVFINLQLKRARIYVKFDHVNQGYPDKPYYTTFNYPGNPRSLKFGVSWNFYD